MQKVKLQMNHREYNRETEKLNFVKIISNWILLDKKEMYDYNLNISRFIIDISEIIKYVLICVMLVDILSLKIGKFF